MTPPDSTPPSSASDRAPYTPGRTPGASRLAPTAPDAAPTPKGSTNVGASTVDDPTPSKGSTPSPGRGLRLLYHADQPGRVGEISPPLSPPGDANSDDVHHETSAFSTETAATSLASPDDDRATCNSRSVNGTDEATGSATRNDVSQEDNAAAAVRWLCNVYGRGWAQPWVRWGMVTSVNGSVVGADGRSGSLGTPADRVAFRALRALADAVVVGAGTARVEDYHLVGSPPDGGTPAVLVVLTRTGDLPEQLRDTAVLVGCPPNAQTAVARRVGSARVVPAANARDLVHQLAARGLTGVLCEGGPSIWADWVGVCDEICCTTSPSLVGLAAFQPSLPNSAMHGPAVCEPAVLHPTEDRPDKRRPSEPNPAGCEPSGNRLDDPTVRPLELASLVVHEHTLLARWRRPLTS